MPSPAGDGSREIRPVKGARNAHYDRRRTAGQMTPELALAIADMRLASAEFRNLCGV